MSAYQQDSLFDESSYKAPTPPPTSTSQEKSPTWKTVVLATVIATALSTGITSIVATNVRSSDSSQTLGVQTTQSQISGTPVASSSDADSVQWNSVSAAVRPSVVTIQVRNNNGGGEGTGVILDDTGRILTNNHVAEPANASGGAIRVVLSDGRLYDATIVGADASTDLAVLQIADPPAAGDKGFVPAKFADSDAVVVGQPVMAVGNPLGLSDTVTTGIISATNRPVVTSGSQEQDGGEVSENVITNALQTDAAINPGNSGGPLVNANGEVVGINSSIATASQSSGSIGLGFAIPSNEAQRVSEEITRTGRVEHAQLGITVGNSVATANGVSRQAARVASVTGGSPAADAGLRTGDLITAINGIATPGADATIALIRSYSPGQVVEVSYVRNGQLSSASATLQASAS